MKGLLIKDILLLKNHRNYLLMILLIGVLLFVENGNLTGGISYVLFASTFATLSTFSYDEAENCMMHLMTLPSGRKNYVKGKYFFGILNPLLFTVLLMTCGSLFEISRGSDITTISDLILATLMVLFMVWILFAIYFPIQIKFGSEKVRVVLLIFVGAVVGMGFILNKLETSSHLANILEQLSGISEYKAAGIICGISIVVITISYAISLNVTKNKEF